MVWFLAPIAWAAGIVVRRKVAVVAGVLIVTYYDEAGEVIGEFIGREAQEAAEAALDGAGAVVSDLIEDTAEAIGDLSLSFIRGLIPAIIDGAQAGYDAIREGFRGKEPETIAALTISVLVVIAALTLLHEVRTGPGGAGEYAANNRFE
jgi:hypothetical protein